MVYNGKKSIDYVKQAFSISDADKEIAITLYKESVSILVEKNYIQQHPDAHTELSAIFGEKWITLNQRGGQFWHDPRLYIESNIAFNYANCLFSKTHQFVGLAKKLVDEDNRHSAFFLMETLTTPSSGLNEMSLNYIFRA
jgi:hypothetical protein